MKSVLITFDQAYYERIMALLDRLGCRGFTYLEKVQGRGSKTGDPHFGSHAWPSMSCWNGTFPKRRRMWAERSSTPFSESCNARQC